LPIDTILAELKAERDRLNQAIAALKGRQPSRSLKSARAPSRSRKGGRAKMSAEGGSGYQRRRRNGGLRRKVKAPLSAKTRLDRDIREASAARLREAEPATSTIKMRYTEHVTISAQEPINAEVFRWSVATPSVDKPTGHCH
jgi:hypothetical protein